MNDYNVSNLGIDPSKAYFNGNEAEYGKSLYVVTEKLNELCLLKFNLDKGDYLRGDYDDDNSPEIELQGYQQYLRRYWTPPILLPFRIPDAVIEGYNKLWYYQYRDSQLQGRDIYGCGWCDDACRTFEFSLQEVSLGIGGNETTLIENKTIIISDDANGYDQVKSIELNQKKQKMLEFEDNESILWRQIILYDIIS
ncbi:MAG: hypothetical protein EZS28_018358 [Streblomastix strix]|uniref:Uncharacterized protein n=1 Tax=Streblomastix strix TaxID=222440 RepID=A0A5J4VU21_9EUKA|nr:MAG: hypothetical protein EZS28_018358 [Streblomastix strix]